MPTRNNKGQKPLPEKTYLNELSLAEWQDFVGFSLFYVDIRYPEKTPLCSVAFITWLIKKNVQPHKELLAFLAKGFSKYLTNPNISLDSALGLRAIQNSGDVRVKNRFLPDDIRTSTDGVVARIIGLEAENYTRGKKETFARLHDKALDLLERETMQEIDVSYDAAKKHYKKIDGKEMVKKHIGFWERGLIHWDNKKLLEKLSDGKQR